MQLTKPSTSSVREYYGKVLRSQSDLRTSACCTPDSFPDHIKDVVAQIDDEVLDRFYGCGSPIPPAIEGCTVLDLGCGTGRDAFIASRLVGASGRVIGLDMTEEQLDVAERHLVSQMERFGYSVPNVDFRLGFIEDLRSAGIEDNSIDVVISNCVINLSPDKSAVFGEIFRVLKDGGELLFSDVFSDRRIPERIANDPVLYGECLGGALYTEDFRRLADRAGFKDFRITALSPVEIGDRDIQNRIGNVRFTSRTIRTFKLPAKLEDRCEDYGQVARYVGTIPHAPFAFDLDDHHRFETGRPTLICGNTAEMLQSTRYGRHFEVIGDRSVHYGLFDCSESVIEAGPAEGGCC